MPRGFKKRQERLPDKLRQIREMLELSQDGILRELDLVEDIDRTYISSYERGRIEPPLYVLLRYARLANVSVDVLIDDALDLPDKIPAKKKYCPE